MGAELELCWGTLLQASLPELIEAAAAAGFGAVTTTPWLYRQSGLSDAALRKLLRDAGVRMTNIDGFASGLPGMPRDEAALEPYRSAFLGLDVRDCFTTPEEEFLRIAEALEGDSINIVPFGGDLSTPLPAIIEATAGIVERAAARGVRIVFEFIPGTPVPDIETGARIVKEIGASNLSLMLDTRHLVRSGGKVADLARHAELIGAVQLSDLIYDAPLNDPDRWLPGEGELPLREIVGILRGAQPQMPLGLEVFSSALMSLPAREVALAAGESLRTLL